MRQIEFLRPRLTGERFNGGTVPLEVLRDLAVLQDLVIETAKWKFLREHPNRRRTPKGFADRIELRLIGVDEGSAIPILALVLYTAALPGFEDERPHVEAAREAILDAVEASVAPGGARQHLPEKSLVLFDRLGRSLRADEAIELPRRDGTTVRFDQDARRRLVREAAGRLGGTEEATLRGQIHEADQAAQTFQLTLADGRRIKAPLDDAHLDAVIDGFTGYREGQWIEVRGVVRADRAGRPIAFESIQRVTLLEALDIGLQLDTLRALRDGWLDGRGHAPSSEGLDWLGTWFDHNLPPDAPLPYLYPTPEGGVQIEWAIGNREISIDLDLERRRGWWHSLDMRSDDEEERDIDFTEPEAGQWIATRLLPGPEEQAR